MHDGRNDPRHAAPRAAATGVSDGSHRRARRRGTGTGSGSAVPIAAVPVHLDRTEQDRRTGEQHRHPEREGESLRERRVIGRG